MSEAKRGDEVNANVVYEKKDVNVFYIAVIALLFIVSAIIIFAAVQKLFKHFDAREANRSKPASFVNAEYQPPPEPRLQSDPAGDLRRMRTSEDAALNNYEWVDRQNGVVRIPIEQAMRLIVEKGFSQTTKDATNNAPKNNAPPVDVKITPEMRRESNAAKALKPQGRRAR